MTEKQKIVRETTEAIMDIIINKSEFPIETIEDLLEVEKHNKSWELKWRPIYKLTNQKQIWKNFTM